jgi:ketosteroid isomerase-like protein
LRAGCAPVQSLGSYGGQHMNAHEIGKKLVQLCKEGKNLESVNTLYSADIVSVEASAPNGGDRESKGIEAIRGKNAWWYANHEIHSAEAHGPYPHGDDKFAVRFLYDVTFKPSGQRFKMDEVAVFHVANDKIVREEFFYTMG